MDLRQQDHGQEPRDQASAKVKIPTPLTKQLPHKSYIVHALNSSFFPVVRSPLPTGWASRKTLYLVS